MNVYAEIADRMREELKEKTGWGRNEVMERLDRTLFAVMSKELESLKAADTPPPGGGSK